MADIKIPFQYCRIERAARFLDCEVEDLLTLGLENKISLNLMLDGVKAIMLVDATVNNAKLWFRKLTKKFTRYGVGISDYSYFSFHSTTVDKNGNNIRTDEFYPDEFADDCCISCTGRTYGLWRLNHCIDEILNYKVTFIDGSELSPCNPKKDNIVTQLFIDKKVEEDTVNIEYEKITDKDLWITATDIRRMLDCKGDYYLLDSLNEIKVLSKTKEQLNHIPSPHPTTERHAINREKIFMAAMRFREEQPHVFAESCRKADGSINYSAFARELIERPFFFPQSTLPMKTVEAIAKVISTAYKSPNQR
ncbi:hypothetical protein [Arsenophonus nasoniae]|uniref:Uncharacterized protein n=1 Tax=Arsenophonus nasoniae TaxID=638 RepID=A0AA95GJ72_9GAMM|nr:hypothetical protein [Arsenophonus nasoniae]MDR5611609.1 hypothetical protein [Arsenophonus sp.]WGM00018.1 hypothetical protein QE210_08865 [Arsenophonus nasoniae]WGM00211.1 hypothetical protein QE210_09930 [Arsenophonus nasoniae]